MEREPAAVSKTVLSYGGPRVRIHPSPAASLQTLSPSREIRVLPTMRCRPRSTSITFCVPCRSARRQDGMEKRVPDLDYCSRAAVIPRFRNRHGKARISVVVERQCGLQQAHTLGVITRSLPRSQNRSSWRSVAPAP